MSEQDGMLVWLGKLLEQIARPYRCDEELPPELQATLRRLGVACDESTPRQDVVAQLWARKRTVLQATPPSAA